MNDPAKITILAGLPDHLRHDAAILYLDAFVLKLGPIIGRDRRAAGFLVSVMRPQSAIAALDSEERLVGIAGFHSDRGSFIGGGFRDLARSFGITGAIWRAVLLSLFERSPEPDELLMDGVVVRSDARGHGVGTALLNHIVQTGRDAGKTAIRLDVVDTNPRARSLYERFGFRPTRVSRARILKPLFGFSATTTMHLALTIP